MIGKREGFYSLSLYFSQGIGLLLGFVIAKLLGPLIYGYYSIGKIVLSYALLFSLGIPNALVKILPHSNNPKKTVNTAISFAFLHSIPALFFSIAILYMKHITITYRTFILFFFAVLFLMVRDILIFSLRGQMKFRKLTILQFISPIVWALYIWFLYYTNQFRAWRVLFGMAVYGLPFFVSSLPFSLSFDVSIYKKLIKNGVPLILGGLLSSLVFQMDRWFIMFSKMPEDMGIYTMAASVAGIFYIFPAALSHIAYSEMVKNSDDNKKYANYHINLIILFSPLIIFIIRILAQYVITHYLKDYSPSIPIIDVLLFSMFFAGIVNILYGIWISLSKWRQFLLFQCIPIGINFLLNYYFLIILKKDIIYAAFATFVSMAVYLGVIIYALQIRIKIIRFIIAAVIIASLFIVPFKIWLILTLVYMYGCYRNYI